MSASAAATSVANVLLPLREEVAVFPGPVALDGSPTWTLHDPTRNLFYRLGWPEFEILSRWNSGSLDRLVQRIQSETTLRIDGQDVEQFARFLNGFNLLQATSPQATADLLAKAERQRQTWWRWLLHNYLFIRIPLFRPDRFLTATYPFVNWLYSRAVAYAVLAVALLGLYLVARQWDVFLSTLVDLFTIRGAVWFGVTLICLKVVHELGHAYTAKRFGCRVPSMGVALMVLIPVLYTDVNEAWKLTARRQRLAIGLAGVTTELCFAAVAACAWGLLPNGPARSAAFLVATSTWVTTVMINLSPFMRYDGYFVLSDWLETPNLHARSFELARWRLREFLFGFGDDPPEHLPDRRRRFMIVFGFLTWAYRFALFLAIALVIYHFTIKILGVIMMAVEIGYFILWPIGREAKVWMSRRADLRLNANTVFTATAALALLILLIVPWRSTIEAPALAKSRVYTEVFVPDFGARVAEVAVRSGQPVDKGATLIRLTSPDLDYRLQRARSDIDVLQWQVGARGIDRDLLARSRVTEQEYEAALAAYRGLLEQQTRLNIVAPISGTAVDLAEALDTGTWLPAKARLLSIIDPSQMTVEAYIDESDLRRVRRGDSAFFMADADSRIAMPFRVAEVARTSTRVLTDPYLASVNGGPIPVRVLKQNELVPDRTIYRVTLTPVGTPAAFDHVLRGQVSIQGEAASLVMRGWRAMLAIIIRESGI